MTFKLLPGASVWAQVGVLWLMSVGSGKEPGSWAVLSGWRWGYVEWSCTAPPLFLSPDQKCLTAARSRWCWLPGQPSPPSGSCGRTTSSLCPPLHHAPRPGWDQACWPATLTPGDEGSSGGTLCIVFSVMTCGYTIHIELHIPLWSWPPLPDCLPWTCCRRFGKIPEPHWMPHGEGPATLTSRRTPRWSPCPSLSCSWSFSSAFSSSLWTAPENRGKVNWWSTCTCNPIKPDQQLCFWYTSYYTELTTVMLNLHLSLASWIIISSMMEK